MYSILDFNILSDSKFIFSNFIKSFEIHLKLLLHNC